MGLKRWISMGVLPIEPEVAKALESMTLLCGQTAWDHGTPHRDLNSLRSPRSASLGEYWKPPFPPCTVVQVCPGFTMRPKVINVSTNYDVVCLSWSCSASTTSVKCIPSFLGCCEVSHFRPRPTRINHKDGKARLRHPRSDKGRGNMIDL